MFLLFTNGGFHGGVWIFGDANRKKSNKQELPHMYFTSGSRSSVSMIKEQTLRTLQKNSLVYCAVMFQSITLNTCLHMPHCSHEEGGAPWRKETSKECQQIQTNMCTSFKLLLALLLTQPVFTERWPEMKTSHRELLLSIDVNSPLAVILFRFSKIPYSERLISS